uniref:Uncharacterized protein n=1 Tax=Anguilla anguilla TaxID=7936 RepID=A0A0E9VSQ2_ANGAN
MGINTSEKQTMTFINRAGLRGARQNTAVGQHGKCKKNLSIFPKY